MEIIQEMMAHSRLASPEFIEMVERAVNMQAQWETAMSPLHKHLDMMQKIKGMDSQQLQELASIVSSQERLQPSSQLWIISRRNDLICIRNSKSPFEMQAWTRRPNTKRNAVTGVHVHRRKLVASSFVQTLIVREPIGNCCQCLRLDYPSS